MTTPGRRALLALALYVGVGLAAPLADAWLAHRGPAEPGHHIESSGTPGCHHAACVLDAPGAPQAPARPPVVAPGLDATASVAPLTWTTQQPDRTPAFLPAPRAPPRLT